MQHKATIFYEWEQGKSAYSFPFPYLSKQFVKVRVDHANASTLLEYNRDYTIEGQTLTLTPVHPFVSGATLCIYRQTPTGSLVDFSDGSLLLASEMDKLSTQLLHVEEENSDLIASTGMFADDDNAWQAQGRRIKNVAAPVEPTDAVHLAYLDGLDIARQSELQRIETLVSEKERQAAESARESKEAATQSAQQFNQTIETRFQTLTTLLQQELSTEYVPQTQGVEMRTAISNASIAILQRNRTYAVGDIAYHKDLPSWAHLECVQAGTTAATLQDLNGVHLGDSVTDGTVLWRVKRFYTIDGDMFEIDEDGGTENDAQPATVGWVKQVFSKLLSSGLTAAGLTCNIAANGYIKLGRLFGGLIIQWGESTVPINRFTVSRNQKVGNLEITFPITFPNYVFAVANNAKAVHTQEAWKVSNASALSVQTKGFVSQMSIPQDVVFIDNGGNEWGVIGTYIAIGY